MKINEKLVSLMRKKDLTYADLDRLTSYSRSTLQRYFTDPNKEISVDMIAELAPILGVDAQWLAGWSDNQEATQTKGIRIPVLGSVRAGIPLEAIEDIVDYEEIPEAMARSGEYFGLMIRGDSMSPVFVEGDVVIVRKQESADTGDAVIALVNGDEATIKRLKRTQEGIVLIPNNPEYLPMVYTNEQIKNLPVRILGKVIELRRKF